jgi:hypothetical protein
MKYLIGSEHGSMPLSKSNAIAIVEEAEEPAPFDIEAGQAAEGYLPIAAGRPQFLIPPDDADDNATNKRKQEIGVGGSPPRPDEILRRKPRSQIRRIDARGDNFARPRAPASRDSVRLRQKLASL